MEEGEDGDLKVKTTFHCPKCPKCPAAPKCPSVPKCPSWRPTKWTPSRPNGISLCSKKAATEAEEEAVAEVVAEEKLEAEVEAETGEAEAEAEAEEKEAAEAEETTVIQVDDEPVEIEGFNNNERYK